MDFLIAHPNGKWLITNPSTSPENSPKGPGYKYFFDEVTSMYYFTTICAGSSITKDFMMDKKPITIKVVVKKMMIL